MRFTIEQQQILRSPAGWIATGFGSGLSPIAPGTVGSLAALLPYLILRELPLPYYLICVALAFCLGIWITQVVARQLQLEDPGLIVWDEFVGQWLALALAPPGWRWILAGFLLFRFFDVWKPWPVNWADRHVPGGLGIMLDDVLAGIYAAAVLAVSTAVAQRI